MRRGSRADAVFANPVRSGRKQPQRIRGGSFRLPTSTPFCPFDKTPLASYAAVVMDDNAPDSDPTEEPMLGMALPVVEAKPAAGAYRVLARKYRPQKFSELIGQDALVQTLSNAIARDRLAHAFLMTGVRGVGKTSTARLIAKGLNCVGADGQGGPTIDPCGVCEPCGAIAEGRHIDVIEMDAASHTGVDDVREIIEAVRYAAVSARYKIYIIDEVHMLSKNAFNALLKTLEEPPAHVKFLFATTEVNKLPVTVLSRCQRFDLRRITPELLYQHFERICAAEGVSADEESLRLIAAAAEGSVRDGLSILDQAIAHADLDGGGRIEAAQVQDMLGLAEGAAARVMLDHILSGDAASAIDALREQYARGVEPAAQIRALMQLVHAVALTRVARSPEALLVEEDRVAVERIAQQLGMAQIQRFWQLLVRARAEVSDAADPLQAAEMALLRIIHAGTLPDPDKLAALLASGPGSGSAISERQAQPAVAAAVPIASPQELAGAPALLEPEPAPVAVTDIWAAPDGGGLTLQHLVQQLADVGAQRIASLLRREARVVALSPGQLLLSRTGAIAGETLDAIRTALDGLGARRWEVALSDAPGAPTMPEREAAALAAREAEARLHPLVDQALKAFPGADFELPDPSEQRAPPPNAGDYP